MNSPEPEISDTSPIATPPRSQSPGRQQDQWDPWDSPESSVEPFRAPFFPELPPEINMIAELPMELTQGDQAASSPPAHDTRETLQAQSREDPLSQADNGSVPEVPPELGPATELPMELSQGDQA